MAHIHEKIDFTATVLVVHKDRVLLRKHDKYGIWIGVGGHIELDEDANTTALREVKEEVGLDVTLVPPPHWNGRNVSNDVFQELIPPAFLNIHYISDTHEHHDLVFVATSDSDTVIPENPTDEWQWLTEKEVLEHPKLEESVRSYALYALQLVRAV